MITPSQIAATRAEQRTDARVTFPDGSIYSAPIGTPLLHYIRAAFRPDHPDQPILGAVVDNQLTELSTPVTHDLRAQPITLRDSDGGRIYRRSLVFLMTAAAEELFPGVKIAVEHSIPSGGYYCQPLARPSFSAEELNTLRGRMREIVEADEPITRSTMPLAEALEWFAAHGDDDMVRLLEMRTKDYLTVYRLRNVIDYLFGYMVPSTGSLSTFDLTPAEEGFVLRYPVREAYGQLQPLQAANKLETVFQRNKKWREVMGLPDIGALNRAISEGRFTEEVLIAEALHTRFIDDIVQQIADRHTKGLRLVVIAGPSSAGKTTFSKRLAVQLMAYGIQPFTLAMDNYFLNRELTPRDENGQYDFESLRAMDVPLLNADLLRLMQMAEAQLPRFNFLTGLREAGEVVRLTQGQIIIAEGIHGLNPELLPDIPAGQIYRIYVSALTALNLDRHNRVPTTDVRLIRRMVRDASKRGYSALDTIRQWESVRRGERRNIFPYQENADVMFNSGLAYELAVLRPLAEPLLRQVEPEAQGYIETKRLLSFLRWVRPATPENVPGDSLLREFVGGSILENYMPGNRLMRGQNGSYPNLNGG